MLKVRQNPTPRNMHDYLSTTTSTSQKRFVSILTMSTTEAAAKEQSRTRGGVDDSFEDVEVLDQGKAGFDKKRVPKRLNPTLQGDIELMKLGLFIVPPRRPGGVKNEEA